MRVPHTERREPGAFGARGSSLAHRRRTAGATNESGPLRVSCLRGEEGVEKKSARSLEEDAAGGSAGLAALAEPRGEEALASQLTSRRGRARLFSPNCRGSTATCER